MPPPHLPAEIWELIYNAMDDVESLCALSQSCRLLRYSITETQYREGLQAVCPWFDPRSSHRKSWRECAVEYSRRLRPGAQLANSVHRALPEGFQSVISHSFDADPEEHDVSPDEEGVWRGVWQRDNDTHHYTSKHGISMSFEREDDFYGRMEDYGYINKCFLVVSFPHMLIICRHFLRSSRTTVAIKYRNSAEPSFHHFRDTSDSRVLVQGTQMFLVLEKERQPSLSTNTFILYLDTAATATRKVVVFEHTFESTLSHLGDWYDEGFDCLPFLYYDGLFHEFRGSRYRVSQVRTHGPPVHQRVMEVGTGTPEYVCPESLITNSRPTLHSYRFAIFRIGSLCKLHDSILDLATGRCICTTTRNGATYTILRTVCSMNSPPNRTFSTQSLAVDQFGIKRSQPFVGSEVSGPQKSAKVAGSGQLLAVSNGAKSGVRSRYSPEVQAERSFDESRSEKAPQMSFSFGGSGSVYSISGGFSFGGPAIETTRSEDRTFSAPFGTQSANLNFWFGPSYSSSQTTRSSRHFSRRFSRRPSRRSSARPSTRPLALPQSSLLVSSTSNPPPPSTNVSPDAQPANRYFSSVANTSSSPAQFSFGGTHQPVSSSTPLSTGSTSTRDSFGRFGGATQTSSAPPSHDPFQFRFDFGGSG